MKKMVTIFLLSVLALSLAGTGFAADPPSPAQEQAICPVMGGKVNQGLFAEYQGERVYFCCPGCLDVFKRNPEKYLKKLGEQR